MSAQPETTENQPNSPNESEAQSANVTIFRRLCKICTLDPGLEGYQDAKALIRSAARNGQRISVLYRELQSRFFDRWPPSSAFSYDSVHQHVKAHLGLDAFPNRVEVRREADRWARTLADVRVERADGMAVLRLLGSLALDQAARGELEFTARDAIRLFGTLHKIEEEERRREDREALLAGTLRLLTEVLGRVLSETQRQQVRDAVRTVSGRDREVMEVRGCLWEWNHIVPPEHGLAAEPPTLVGADAGRMGYGRRPRRVSAGGTKVPPRADPAGAMPR